MKNSIIYGIHSVESAIKNNPKNISEIFLHENRKDQRLITLLDLAKHNKIQCHFVSSEKLDAISEKAHHQGVIASINAARNYSECDLLELIQKSDSPPLILILDGIQDPHNLGAILRTADASGVTLVIAPKDHSVGITPAVRKVASGAAETVPFIQVTNLARTMQEIQKQGIWIYGLDEAGDLSLFNTELKGPIAIAMGAEGAGLRRLTKKYCDYLISIPMKGTVESLNVSVATGIVLYECLRQKNAHQ